MSDTMTITGNVTSVPERVEVAGGVTMVRFGLASTERRLDGGNWTDVHTNFYNVAVFRTLAEHAYRSLERGQRVIVVGKLKVRPWEANGRSGTSVDIEASSLGPDLMFGTTSFTKSARSSAAPAGNLRAADGAEGREAAWATPEALSEIDSSVSSAGEAQERELVGANGWSEPLDVEQRPF